MWFTLKPIGWLVGFVGIQPRRLEIGYFQIGYWIATHEMGNGYGSEACRLATQICLHKLGAKRVELEIAKSNGASQIVARRNGYHFEACLRNRCIGADGQIDDSFIYSMS